MTRPDKRSVSGELERALGVAGGSLSRSRPARPRVGLHCCIAGASNRVDLFDV